MYNTGPEGAGIFLHRSSNKAKVYSEYTTMLYSSTGSTRHHYKLVDRVALWRVKDPPRGRLGKIEIVLPQFIKDGIRVEE